MSTGPVEEQRFRIVILGGGTAGWMTATALARRLDAKSYVVTLIESDAIGTVGVGEATLPHIKQFNDMLGLDEADFMRATRATFKLGIEFRDWNRCGDRYLHPFGAYGEPWGGVGFEHHWLRLRSAGRVVAPFPAYSYACVAAQCDKFEFPNEDPASIRSTYAYAYHFDSARYAGYLRDWAVARGVHRIEGRVDVVDLDPNGAIAALRLQSGELIAGDLFVDCSGFASLLLGKALGTSWEDWRHWLPCDRALAVACDHADGDALTPYTCATAKPFGWQWRIPLQHRIGNGYIFSNDFASEEQVHVALLSGLEGNPQGEPRLLRFSPGRRRVAWAANCVGIGLASGFLEPLESTSIYLIQSAITDLVALMPAPHLRAVDPRLAAEFNRLTALQYDRVRDFLILHYVANARVDEPLWDHCRTMAIPESLAHKVALFRARGTPPDYRHGLFSRDSWLAVLFGQGVEPTAYDPLADAFDLDAVDAQCADFKDRIDLSVASMPSHRDFVRGYCAAAEGVAA